MHIRTHACAHIHVHTTHPGHRCASVRAVLSPSLFSGPIDEGDENRGPAGNMDDAVIRWRLSASPRDCTRAFVHVRIGKKSFFPSGKKGSTTDGIGDATGRGWSTDRPVIVGFYWNAYRDLSISQSCDCLATRPTTGDRIPIVIERAICARLGGASVKSRKRLGARIVLPSETGPKISRTSRLNGFASRADRTGSNAACGSRA